VLVSSYSWEKKDKSFTLFFDKWPKAHLSMSVIVTLVLCLKLQPAIKKRHDSNCSIAWFRGGTWILLPCGMTRLILVMIAHVFCFLWLGANPFPTLNRRSILGFYQKDLVREAISRTEDNGSQIKKKRSLYVFQSSSLLGGRHISIV